MSALKRLGWPLAALVASTAQAQDHSGHATHLPVAAQPPVQSGPVEIPTDHAADRAYNPAEMARARERLRFEAGGMPNSKLMIDRLEWRPGPGRDGYSWELEGWAGGDIDRVAVKSKGEGAFGNRAERIELQAGWFHALDPWFNLRLGARQDFQPRPRRTQAVIAIEGLAPYWFEVEGELFVSQKGEVTARAEASYDQRLTQRLILQPRAEITLSAQNVPQLDMGSGLTSIELGLRLRYEFVREFAPYVGINWERQIGGSARYARIAGDKPGQLRAAIGARFWF